MNGFQILHQYILETIIVKTAQSFISLYLLRIKEILILSQLD